MPTGTYQVSPNSTVATQVVWAGSGTTLITNTDLKNTIYIGESNSISPTDGSGIIPLLPNGSLVADGTRDFFAVTTSATPVTVAVLEGGLATFLGITQGMGSLAIPSIFSPNFIHDVSGWSIDKNGSAEFNNLTLRGTFNGTDFIINSAGAFFYSGTPALGNLVLSITQNGGTNDGFGNPYKQGVTAYGSNTAISQWTNGTSAALIMYLLTSITLSASPQLFAGAVNSGLVNEQIQLALTSGRESGHDDAALQLFSESADTTAPARAVIEFGGQVVVSVSRNGIYANQPGTTDSPETWHNVTLLNGWANQGFSRYKLIGYNVMLLELQINDSAATSGVFMNMPAGYSAVQSQFITPLIYNPAGTPAMCTVQVSTGTNGALTILQWSKQSRQFLGNFFISLD